MLFPATQFVALYYGVIQIQNRYRTQTRGRYSLCKPQNPWPHFPIAAIQVHKSTLVLCGSHGGWRGREDPKRNAQSSHGRFSYLCPLLPHYSQWAGGVRAHSEAVSACQINEELCIRVGHRGLASEAQTRGVCGGVEVSGKDPLEGRPDFLKRK